MQYGKSDGHRVSINYNTLSRGSGPRINNRRQAQRAAMIAFENVSKSFWTGKSRKVILDRASFSVEIGNSLGILAKNGTGKTTLINMMAGLEKPDEGRVIRTSRISFPLGFMGGIVGKHTAKENARYIARLYALDPDYVESFCRWLSNIDEYFDMPLGTYSSGMRSRFSFALMLALEFDIYLIDEGMPSSTDVEFNRKAGQVLRQRLNDATVVIVSHQAATLEKFCRSAAVLRNGQLYKFDTLEEAKRLYDYEA
jgi:capsular polysaccharide transport system ATP-binding protein